MVRRVYLSGPMTGIADRNFPAFHAAAADLRSRGVDVVNPAEINADLGKAREACLRADIKALCDCDALMLLPGWQRSKGAQLELHVAHRLGIAVEFYVKQPLRCDGCGKTIAQHGPLLQCRAALHDAFVEIEAALDMQWVPGAALKDDGQERKR